jgi:site-specific DNA-cytosine methylase
MSDVALPSFCNVEPGLLGESLADDEPTKTTKNLLKKLTPDLLQQLQANVTQLGAVSLGSMCSGSNITSVLVANLLEVLKTGTPLRDVFSCEVDAQKQEFLKYVAVWLGQSCSHNIFSNINEMGEHGAHCSNHDNTICTIPPAPLIMTCGFSCKNFSKLYQNKKRTRILKNILEKGGGTTGNTCQGMLAFIKAHAPPFLIWENVPAILEKGQERNHAYLLKAFHEAGYASATGSANSIEFHLPQIRRRAYGVIVHVGKSGLGLTEASKLAEKILKTKESMACVEPVSIEKFLLEPGDDYLKKQLVILKAARPKTMRKEASGKKLLWRKALKAICKSRGILYKKLKLPTRIGSAWLRALPLREQLGVALHVGSEKGLTAIETSQAIGRMSRSRDANQIKTITPKGRWVLLPPMVKHSRVLTGYEKMRMQGFPDDFIRDYLASTAVKKHGHVDRFLSELSGNAFSGPVIEAIVISVLAHLQPGHLKDYGKVIDSV